MGAKGSKRNLVRAASQAEKDSFVKWALERKLKQATIDALLAADFDDFDALIAASEEDFKGISDISVGQRVLLRKAISELKDRPLTDYEEKNQDLQDTYQTLVPDTLTEKQGQTEKKEGQLEAIQSAESISRDRPRHQTSESTGAYINMRGKTTQEKAAYLEPDNADIYSDRDINLATTSDDYEYDKIQRRVKAIYAFTARTTNELSFKANERFVVLNTVDQWWFVRHAETGQTGYIPSNYVVVDKIQDWWFDISRQEANEHLLMPGLRNGTYCVRRASEKNAMALSVRCQKSTSAQLTDVRHYKIKLEDDGQTCYIVPRMTFQDVDSLIKFYQENRGLCGLLFKPCPRIPQTVPFKEMEVDRDTIKILGSIAEGNFGTVYKGKWKNQIDVAVKMLKPEQMEKSSFLEEARMMHRLRHRHLVQLMGVCTIGDPFYIITEFMEHGSLREYLIEADKREVNFLVLISIAAQITDGMTYLEKHNCIHRDIRAANMLVGTNKMVKIADFGLARLASEEYISTGSKIPVKWTSPESYRHRKFTVKSDVWSFGVLLYEIITYGEVPYPGIPNDKVQRMVQKNYRMPKPTKYLCPDDIYEKMIQCWHPEPSERPSFEKLHVFFTKYRLKKSDIPAQGYYNAPEVIDDDIDEDYECYIKFDYLE